MLRLLAGRYSGHQGYVAKYLPLDYYDVHLEPDGTVEIPVDSDRSVMIFTLLGDAYVGGELVKEKTAAKLGNGDKVVLRATSAPSQILFISSRKLDEPVAWGGPIVMNTRKELNQAFEDLRKGTFLRSKIEY